MSENTFAERLLQQRKKLKLSRRELAQKANVTDRTIQYYENGDRYPDINIVQQLATALDTTVSYLLNEQTNEIKSVKDARPLVDEVTGLFAGGDLPQEDKDIIMQAFSEAYFKAKTKKENTD